MSTYAISVVIGFVGFSEFGEKKQWHTSSLQVLHESYLVYVICLRCLFLRRVYFRLFFSCVQGSSKIAELP